MTIRLPYAAVLACFTLSGCIYANVTTPLAYRSSTPADVGGIDKLGEEVEGTACSHNVLGLVAWGDGGYAKAVEHAKASLGRSGVLSDVRADSKALNILSVYGRVCTVVHARAAK